jgi:hypothetical protein
VLHSGVVGHDVEIEVKVGDGVKVREVGDNGQTANLAGDLLGGFHLTVENCHIRPRLGE